MRLGGWICVRASPAFEEDLGWGPRTHLNPPDSSQLSAPVAEDLSPSSGPPERCT
ncbi:hypothetical protein I79_016189 [Cricetulus griseus]|uniref:Uncharacterized protein n=1 Tax=Cricetulus griseus TaxID=10029 RepID=G3HYP8_CRIGR|nr:hypothetical protein I79_016189 [Cricetulus griseus]